MPALDQGSEELEYALWVEMKAHSTDRLHEELTSTDDSRRRAAARELHRRGLKETADIAALLAKDSRSSVRGIAAAVLGQLGTPGRPFLDRSLPILLHLLKQDESADVRAEAAAALGHLRSNQSFNELAIASFDSDTSVRADVAFALGMIGDSRSVEPLLRLTHDESTDVVSNAVTGLRLLDIDSSAIRERFVEMLRSEVPPILDEIIGSLSHWRDSRVLPALRAALGRDEILFELLTAASELGDKSLLPRLYELRDRWSDDPPKDLTEAIARLETDSRDTR